MQISFNVLKEGDIFIHHTGKRMKKISAAHGEMLEGNTKGQTYHVPRFWLVDVVEMDKTPQ